MISSQMSTMEILEARLRDRDAMRRAARQMDELRKRCGKPEKDFESLTVLRKIRQAR